MPAPKALKYELHARLDYGEHANPSLYAFLERYFLLAEYLHKALHNPICPRASFACVFTCNP